MTHGALALLQRSLRFDARRRPAHAFRLACIGLVFVMLVASHILAIFVGAPGLRFFQSICFLSFTLSTLAGCSYFASAITEEKQEGTLGLLKLADLSALSILLGKSTSRFVCALLIVIGQFPFALLAITLGGVTVRQVAAAYVALAAYLVFVANLGLLASVVCRRGSEAALVAGLTIFLLIGGPPLLQEINAVLIAERLVASGGAWVAWCDRGTSLLEQISVLERLMVILETGFAESVVTRQVVANAAMGAACFAGAWFAFDRFTEYLTEPVPRRVRNPRLSDRRRRRTPRVWFGIQSPRAWRRALAWKDYQFLAGGAALSLAKLAAYPLLFAGLYWQRDWLQRAVGLPFHELARTSILAIAAVELLIYASRIFHAERMDGTLSTLLMLPRSSWAITFEKTLGCLCAVMPTWIAFAAIYALLSARFEPLYHSLARPEVALVVVGFIVLLHLTAFFSLLLRWGAFAAAVATFLVVGTFALPILAITSAALRGLGHAEYTELGPIVYVGGLLVAALQFGIIVRLRHSAAYG